MESWDPYSKLTTPRTYNWNVTIEQELKHDWLLRAAYVGSRANHLSVTVDQNAAIYTAGSSLSTDQRRPFAGFSNIYQDSQAGNSWYQSAQLTLQKRFSHGFTIMANVLPSDLFASESVASVSGLSGTGAGIGTIIAFILIGHFSDARQATGTHSFDPIILVAGLVPFIGMILALLLIRNTKATDQGSVRRI